MQVQAPLYDTVADPRTSRSNEPVDGIKVVSTLNELMQVFAIRSAVFVGEQVCPFEEEFDGNDLAATHLLGVRGKEPIACLRIRWFAGFAKLERLAVRHEFRNSRMSFKIVRAAIDLIRKKGYRQIAGQSQDRLLKWWCFFGFRPVPKRRELVFSDFSYTEIVMDIEPDPEAITIETDPYVMIRPEGAWHKIGVLEEFGEPAGHLAASHHVVAGWRRRGGLRRVTPQMTVVPFGRTSRPASLITVFADYQREYVTLGRPYAIADTAPALLAAKRWLETARSMMLPIAHFRQFRSEATFNRASAFADFIEGFRPRTDETLYERARPSCYGAVGFGEFLDQIADPLIVLAGLSGDQACLATAVEATGRGHRVIFLADCSATPSLAGLDEDAAHSAVTAVIGRYGEVATSEELIGEMNARAVVRTGAPTLTGRERPWIR